MNAAIAGHRQLPCFDDHGRFEPRSGRWPLAAPGVAISSSRWRRSKPAGNAGSSRLTSSRRPVRARRCSAWNCSGGSAPGHWCWHRTQPFRRSGCGPRPRSAPGRPWRPPIHPPRSRALPTSRCASSMIRPPPCGSRLSGGGLVTGPGRPAGLRDDALREASGLTGAARERHQREVARIMASIRREIAKGHGPVAAGTDGAGADLEFDQLLGPWCQGTDRGAAHQRRPDGRARRVPPSGLDVGLRRPGRAGATARRARGRAHRDPAGRAHHRGTRPVYRPARPGQLRDPDPGAGTRAGARALPGAGLADPAARRPKRPGWPSTICASPS